MHAHPNKLWTELIIWAQPEFLRFRLTQIKKKWAHSSCIIGRKYF